MNSNRIEFILDKVEESMKCGSMLIQFQLGIALKVIEDRLEHANPSLAHRCNNLQHKILEDNNL